jgi:hypothetical protein
VKSIYAKYMNSKILNSEGHLNPLFSTWTLMISRCHNPKDRTYHKYGKRGITVCDRWIESFNNFLIDMGERPDKTFTLDRIDNNKGYFLENCQWATRKQQARNRRNTLRVEYQGVTWPLAELCEKLGKDYEIVRGRIRHGTPIEKALTDEKYSFWAKFPHKGKKVSLQKYCELNNLNYGRVKGRLRNGWSFERATCQPAKENQHSPDIRDPELANEE